MSVVLAVYFWIMGILGQPVPICDASTNAMHPACPVADVGTATTSDTTHYGNPSEREFISNGF